jgi:transporter family-2 protein
MIWAILATLAGGFAVALQAPINGRLSAGLGDSIAAAAVSFAVGFATLALLTLMRGAVPAADRWAAMPWWAWVGGALGAFFVWSTTWSVGRLGVVTLVSAVILGQMAAALVIDAVGAFGLPAREITAQRLAAVGLVAAGLVLSRL